MLFKYLDMSSIITLAGNHVPHASPGLGNVTCITRYEMNMGVSNCLPCDCSAIHANVKPVWMVFSCQVFSDSPDQVEAGVIIIERQVENVCDVLLGDDQRVSSGHRVPIAN